MKKIRLLLISLISMILFLPSVLAASGNVSITGPSQVVSGNKVTITVNLTSQTKIGSWQMNLNYDKTHLQLVSSSAEAGGTMMASSSATGVTKKSYTFTFKTLKTGTVNFSITSALAYAFDDLSPMSLKTSGKSIKIITQAELEASYSKDNNLKSLSVEGFELSPEFKKDVTEYNVIVPEDTKTINIKAQENDSKANVSGDGEKTVSAGTNNFDVVVRAENGSEKTYKIIVEVKDSNPINVNVNNTSYTVVKIREYLPDMKSYDETTVNINDFEIPAFKSSATEIVLVGLKDSNGNIEMFIYKDGNYLPYKVIDTNQLTILPKDTDKELEGLSWNKDTEINGIKTTIWYLDEKSNFVVIYGVDIESGNEGFWTYDKKNNSLIAFDNDLLKLINEYEEKINLYSYIIIGFSGILLIMIILLLVKNKKRNKKHNTILDEEIEEKQIEEPKTEELEENTIVEIDETPKKKNKKKKS